MHNEFTNLVDSLTHAFGTEAMTNTAPAEVIEGIAQQLYDSGVRSTNKISSYSTQPGVIEGRWERCTPQFLENGGVCASEPRRALWLYEKKDEHDVGHCHWTLDGPLDDVWGTGYSASEIDEWSSEEEARAEVAGWRAKHGFAVDGFSVWSRPNPKWTRRD